MFKGLESELFWWFSHPSMRAEVWKCLSQSFLRTSHYFISFVAWLRVFYSHFLPTLPLGLTMSSTLVWLPAGRDGLQSSLYPVLTNKDSRKCNEVRVKHCKNNYCTRAIITRGLYIFYSIFEDHCFFKEVFLSLCMVSIQEWFLIKSGLLWRAYSTYFYNF